MEIFLSFSPAVEHFSLVVLPRRIDFIRFIPWRRIDWLTNRTLLLEYADGKYGYREFMSLVDRCDGPSDNDADPESGEPGILLKEMAG